MTKDNNRTTDTNKTPKASHAEVKTQAAVSPQASGTIADVPAGGAEKDYQGTITITPPSETMYLYKWYPLTVSCDHTTPWGVFMNTGPETPLPGDDKPGHIFLFDRSHARLNNGSGTINIMAIGPNAGTKVTVYGRSLDASIPGKVDLEFVASDSPPSSIFGLFALNGQPWRMPQDNGLPYLVGAVYMDKDGKPLTGDIHWTVSNDSNATTDLLSPTTPLRANGTSSNGVIVGSSMCGSDGWFGVTVTASVDDTSLTTTLPEYAVFYDAAPNISFTLDTTQTTLTATCPQFQEGAEVIWEAYPPDRVQLQYRRTKVTNGSATNTIEVATTATDPFTAYFAASTMDTTGNADHNYLRDYGVVQLQLTPSTGCTIEITSESYDADKVPLYVEDTLTATVKGDDCGISEIEWSVDSDTDAAHEFIFDPNPSKVNGTTATTTISALGDNSDVNVTAYARPVGTNSKVKKPGNLPLTFKQQPDVPAGTVLSVVSLDGNPLQDGSGYHLLEASYVNLDLTRATTAGWDGTVSWSSDDPGLTWATTDPTPTDNKGVARNAIKRATAGDVTVTVQATGTSESPQSVTVTFADDAAIPGLGSMTIDPVDGAVPTGTPQPLKVTYLDDKQQPMPEGTEVIWSGSPADRLTFSGGSGGGTGNISKVTGDDGIAAINVTASDGGDIATAVIGTRGAFITQAGAYDHSDPDQTLSFYDRSGNIVVNPPSDLQPPLYDTEQTITATYTKGGKGVEGASVVWTCVPEGKVEFSPNPSEPTDGTGTATTKLTGYGLNSDPGSAAIYALTYNADTKKTVAGSRTVTFGPGTLGHHRDDGRLVVDSLEGTVLWGLTWHVLRATYVDLEGNPITGQRQVDWSVLPPATGAVVLHADTTTTDDNGVTMNMVHGPGPYPSGQNLLKATIQASTINPNTNNQETGSLPLTLTKANVTPASPQLKIDVGGTLPLENGYAWPITAKYTKADLKTPKPNVPIYWGVYPYNEPGSENSEGYTLSIGSNPAVTGADGVAHSTIAYTGTDELVGAVLTASAFNPRTGEPDFASTTLNFAYADPITGITINRPWAQNPDDTGVVDPTVPCEVVTGKLTVAKRQGDGQIALFAPSNPPITVFDIQGNQISPTNGKYILTTQDSSVEFLIGARASCFFDLMAYYPPDSTEAVCTTNLTLSSLGGPYASSRPTLVINGLPIPDPSAGPAPTFQVSLPAGTSIDPSLPVEILLNYRVAYAGKVGDIIAPKAADIGYALLQSTGNQISCLVSNGRSASQIGYQTFDAGTNLPQTRPNTGGATPWFASPTIIANGAALTSTIQATDIVNGLHPLILPTSTQQSDWSYQAGDVITIYYYLSGTFPLPTYSGCPSLPKPVYNVCAVKHPPLTNQEDLTGGEMQLLEPLQQRFLAGYGAPGTFQANFKVERGNQTFWSAPTGVFTLNTATLDPAS